MAATAIVATGLSKRFRVGGPRASYTTLRDTIAGTLGAPLRRAARRGGPRAGEHRTDFWALEDVSFEIAEGEAVGFVGRNGAGKTTLLKLLSRITRPSRGWAEVYGRVGSLLEVGTGFHGELTGRENIYLNGAILGLTRRDIRQRFDEIVAFAEVGDFLDMPVKRYSSGMTVRLAFSVAAHLEPAILLVDEVLAVGDVGFQRKCLGKMTDVTAEGRTVLFVSHNTAILRALCGRGILLEKGRVRGDGPIDDIVDAYLATLEQQNAVEVLGRDDRRGANAVMLARVEVIGSGGHAPATGSPATFGFDLTGVCGGLSCSFTVYDRLGHPVTTLSSAPGSPEDLEDPSSEQRIECAIDELPLAPGRYRVDVTIRGGGELQDHLEGATFFDVEPGLVGGRPVTGDLPGSLVVSHRWTLPRTSARAASRHP